MVLVYLEGSKLPVTCHNQSGVFFFFRNELIICIKNRLLPSEALKRVKMKYPVPVLRVSSAGLEN